MRFDSIGQRESAHQACERVLRRAILLGTLAAGQPLPSERTLAAELGVSRLTLRAALAALDRAGMISVRHGSRSIVRDVLRDGGPDLLAGLADLASERGELPALAAELLRARRHLAHAALEALVEHPPTAAAVRAVVAAIDAMAAAGPAHGAIAQADLAVLAALLDATRSPVLRLCMNPVAAVVSGNPALCAAIFVDPANNIAAWRTLATWLTRPRASSLARILGALAARDAATIEELKRGRHRGRS